MQKLSFTETEIQHLVKKHYGIIATVKVLPGYEEQNYKLLTKLGQQYILKLSEVKDNLELLHAQAHMMGCLYREIKMGFPIFQKTLSGERIIQVEAQSGRLFYVRVLRFLPGIFFAESQEHTDELLRSLGTFLGKMDRQLQDFNHWGAHRYMDWDLQHVLDLEEALQTITSPADQRTIAYFLLQFKEEVQPQLPHLRRAVIHNDANDWNVLVDQQSQQVTGLIDFGDIVYAPLINNLAIAIAYAILDKDDPIKASVPIVQGYHAQYALEEKEVDLLYYLVAARLSMSLLHSGKQKFLDSTNAHHFLTEKPALVLLHKLVSINPLKMQQAHRRACGFSLLYNEKTRGYGALLERRANVLGKNLSISYQHNLKIIKGALQYLFDDQGNTYLDCVNNVSHVGHCHPRVVREMRKQIAKLNTNTRYLHDTIATYAEALLATLPKELEVCYFVNSGSEANDLAVRMARHYTGQKDVIVLDHAYHGTSTLALEMSPYKFDGKGGFAQASYIHKAQNPDGFRGPFKYLDKDAGKKYAEDIDRIVKKLKEVHKKPAAFICETLLGVGGQIPLPEGYLNEAYQRVRAAGGLAIADEVQVGFGRVGRAFWGFQLQQVVPDIVVMGKPIGNGHPLAAVVVTRKVAEAFNNGMEYFNTFGGNPVSMATGLAVLKIIQEEGLQQHALTVGTHLLNGLKDLQKKYGFIGDVRGEGLFVGVEFVKGKADLTPETTLLNRTVEKMRERGFLLSTDGPLHNVLKIKPPLVFSQKNAEDLVIQLDKTLKELTT